MRKVNQIQEYLKNLLLSNQLNSWIEMILYQGRLPPCQNRTFQLEMLRSLIPVDSR